LNGKDEELTSILSKYSFLVNWRNKEDKKTPLYYAIEGNHPSTCELLLDFGSEFFMKRTQYQVYCLRYSYLFFLSFLLFFFLRKTFFNMFTD